MKPRRSVLISIIAGTTAVALGASGWLVYNNVQLENARADYEASLAELGAVQSNADSATTPHPSAFEALGASLRTAEALVTLLGEGTDTLKAASDATLAARAFADTHRLPARPATSAGSLPEGPGVDDYSDLTERTLALTVIWKTHTTQVADAIADVTTARETLAAAWQAQIDTAAEFSASAIKANRNASRKAKDAAASAAEALTALTDPLAPEAVDLWKALLDAKKKLATQQKAYEKKKAAEQNASSSGGWTGGSGTSGGGGGSYSLAAIAAALAAQLGIPASQVTCYDIPNGVRCDWPGGSRTYTI